MFINETFRNEIELRKQGNCCLAHGPVAIEDRPTALHWTLNTGTIKLISSFTLYLQRSRYVTRYHDAALSGSWPLSLTTRESRACMFCVRSYCQSVFDGSYVYELPVTVNALSLLEKEKRRAFWKEAWICSWINFDFSRSSSGNKDIAAALNVP